MNWCLFVSFVCCRNPDLYCSSVYAASAVPEPEAEPLYWHQVVKTNGLATRTMDDHERRQIITMQKFTFISILSIGAIHTVIKTYVMVRLPWRKTYGSRRMLVQWWLFLLLRDFKKKLNWINLRRVKLVLNSDADFFYPLRPLFLWQNKLTWFWLWRKWSVNDGSGGTGYRID